MVDPAQQVREYLANDATWAAALALIADAAWPVYVVGGTVRDALLGRSNDDLDLAVAGPAISLARKLADGLGAAFYPLDVERDVGRVLVQSGCRTRHIDVAALRAEGITADLMARDFTVNAMALQVGVPGSSLLDPTAGLDDLRHRTIRMASSRSFDDDPARVLRLARMRSMLQGEATAETERMAERAAPLLARVTHERVRDELLATLALTQAAEALRYAVERCLLDAVFGDPDDVDRLAAGIAALEALGQWQASSAKQPLALQSYASHLSVYWAVELTSRRPRWLLTRLAALLAGWAQSHATRERILARLHLSRREVEHVRGIWSGRASLTANAPTDDLGWHRYYRQFGEAGVDAAIMALASQECAVEVAVQALSIWFERQDEVVAPPMLVTGNDLMLQLRLAPAELGGRAGALGAVALALQAVNPQE